MPEEFSSTKPPIETMNNPPYKPPYTITPEILNRAAVITSAPK